MHFWMSPVAVDAVFFLLVGWSANSKSSNSLSVRQQLAPQTTSLVVHLVEEPSFFLVVVVIVLEPTVPLAREMSLSLGVV